jgi:hypothetical protein
MTKSPIYDDHEIIAAGETIERQEGCVEPWKLFKALGGRGRYDRVREVWERHLASRGRPKAAATAAALPEPLANGIARQVCILMESLNEHFAEHDAAVTADHVAQLQLMQRQHANELEAKADEVQFWRERAAALEVEVDELRAREAQPWPLSLMHRPEVPTSQVSHATPYQGRHPEPLAATMRVYPPHRPREAAVPNRGGAGGTQVAEGRSSTA